MKLYVVAGLAGLALAVSLVAAFKWAPRFGGPPLADAASWIGIVANLLAVAVSAFSLLVAFAAYRDAKAAGDAQTIVLKEQKGVLENSRVALSGVVDQLAEQRKLLDQTLDASTKHLELAKSVYAEERRRAARRAKLVLTIGNFSDEQLNALPELAIPMVPADGWIEMTFQIANTGELDVPDPLVIFQASPGVRLERRRQRGLNATALAGRLQVTGEVPIRTLDTAGGGVNFEIDAQVPDEDNKEFSILMVVLGTNANRTERLFKFRAVRRAAAPAN